MPLAERLNEENRGIYSNALAAKGLWPRRQYVDLLLGSIQKINKAYPPDNHAQCAKLFFTQKDLQEDFGKLEATQPPGVCDLLTVIAIDAPRLDVTADGTVVAIHGRLFIRGRIPDLLSRLPVMIYDATRFCSIYNVLGVKTVNPTTGAVTQRTTPTALIFDIDAPCPAAHETHQAVLEAFLNNFCSEMQARFGLRLTRESFAVFFGAQAFLKDQPGVLCAENAIKVHLNVGDSVVARLLSKKGEPLAEAATRVVALPSAAEKEPEPSTPLALDPVCQEARKICVRCEVAPAGAEIELVVNGKVVGRKKVGGSARVDFSLVEKLSIHIVSDIWGLCSTTQALGRAIAAFSSMAQLYVDASVYNTDEATWQLFRTPAFRHPSGGAVPCTKLTVVKDGDTAGAIVAAGNSLLPVPLSIGWSDRRDGEGGPPSNKALPTALTGGFPFRRPGQRTVHSVDIESNAPIMTFLAAKPSGGHAATHASQATTRAHAVTTGNITAFQSIEGFVLEACSATKGELPAWVPDTALKLMASHGIDITNIRELPRFTPPTESAAAAAMAIAMETEPETAAAAAPLPRRETKFWSIRGVLPAEAGKCPTTGEYHKSNRLIFYIEEVPKQPSPTFVVRVQCYDQNCWERRTTTGEAGKKRVMQHYVSPTGITYLPNDAFITEKTWLAIQRRLNFFRPTTASASAVSTSHATGGGAAGGSGGGGGGRVAPMVSLLAFEDSNSSWPTESPASVHCSTRPFEEVARATTDAFASRRNAEKQPRASFTSAAPASAPTSSDSPEATRTKRKLLLRETSPPPPSLPGFNRLRPTEASSAEEEAEEEEEAKAPKLKLHVKSKPGNRPRRIRQRRRCRYVDDDVEVGSGSDSEEDVLSDGGEMVRRMSSKSSLTRPPRTAIVSSDEEEDSVDEGASSASDATSSAESASEDEDEDNHDATMANACDVDDDDENPTTTTTAPSRVARERIQELDVSYYATSNLHTVAVAVLAVLTLATTDKGLKCKTRTLHFMAHAAFFLQVAPHSTEERMPARPKVAHMDTRSLVNNLLAEVSDLLPKPTEIKVAVCSGDDDDATPQRLQTMKVVDLRPTAEKHKRAATLMRTLSDSPDFAALYARVVDEGTFPSDSDRYLGYVRETLLAVAAKSKEQKRTVRTTLLSDMVPELLAEFESRYAFEPIFSSTDPRFCILSEDQVDQIQEDIAEQRRQARIEVLNQERAKRRKTETQRRKTESLEQAAMGTRSLMTMFASST